VGRCAGTEHLGPELTLASGEVNLPGRAPAAPPGCRFDRKGVRGVADHLGVPDGGDDPVLADRGYRAAGAQGRDRRQLNPGEPDR
jgi:hypothetical protein